MRNGFLTLVLVGCLVAAGCGDDDDKGPLGDFAPGVPGVPNAGGFPGSADAAWISEVSQNGITVDEAKLQTFFEVLPLYKDMTGEKPPPAAAMQKMHPVVFAAINGKFAFMHTRGYVNMEDVPPTMRVTDAEKALLQRYLPKWREIVDADE